MAQTALTVLPSTHHSTPIDGSPTVDIEVVYQANARRLEAHLEAGGCPDCECCTAASCAANPYRPCEPIKPVEEQEYLNYCPCVVEDE